MAKAGTSEKQKEANRQNAKKSTGPKTIQGKEASKRNAVKHGLAGKGEAVPDEIAEEMDARAGQWMAVMKPGEGVEAWLVDRAAGVTMVSLSNTALEGCMGAFPDNLRRAVYGV